MLNLSQRQTMQMRLTPQQVQYLQLLQLPVLALEQRIKAELEINPLLEEGEDMELTQEQIEEKAVQEVSEESQQTDKENKADEDRYTFEDFMNDNLDGYKATMMYRNDEDRDEYPQPAEVTLSQKLKDQIFLLELTEQEKQLCDEIIGNIDDDGYLQREIGLIVQDINLSQGHTITIERAEEILKMIQHLEPPGIGARNLQECLIAQLESNESNSELTEKALKILREYFEDFTMKHYEDLAKNLNMTVDELKPIIELIQKLNPKPGEGQFTPQQNYIIPDFTVERDDDDFIVMLNDKNVPPIRISHGYKELMTRKYKNGAADGVRDFIRKRFEAAKWFITSINQRRETMLKVMRAIIEKQRTFFETGENLKPMIYKDITEIIHMDISTISRVVNGKYVQTEFGVFELRHFFSDKLTTSTGEEISNKEVKNQIREIIGKEDTNHPLSDDRIAEILNNEGLNIARRTVAKYREAMKIPVARLRRKI
ncbi:MAG: RNA polymerase factor sigma-54 [Bacteroidota bacterium]|nr:RNA polymerase factor sigma-54 [Bacteroidota bacterium]